MDSYTIARGMPYGWATVKESGLPAQFLQKRVYIESLDKNGKVIDKIEVSHNEKNTIMAALYAIHGVRLLINEMYPKLFTELEYETAIKVLEEQYRVVPTESEIMEVRSLFDKYNYKRVALASEMEKSGQYSYGYFAVTPKSPYFGKKFSFKEALDFLSEREGLYYAVNNDGNRCYDFVDKPNKSQINYQKKKNGNEVVFLNFEDWTEYKIS
ncbi:hypothetical protein [Paenibacillus lautus]|uniref:hypothetical protein n=1 Tax=Paenibacillus lautus TaxID=1401 RepID=UPI003D2BDED0